MDHTSMNSDKDGTYLLITNIPHIFRSRDLQNYFSYYIDKTAFHSFHFLHITEASMMEYLKSIKESSKSNVQYERSAPDSKTETNSILGKRCRSELHEGIGKLSEIIESSKKIFESIEMRVQNPNKKIDPNMTEEIGKYSCSEEPTPRCCALILIKQEYLDSFKAQYNRKFWVNIDGIILAIRCLIFDLTVILKLKEIHIHTLCDENLSYPTKLTVREQKKRLYFEKKKKKSPIEFDKSSIMPQGNVGTPNSYFKSLLKQSKLGRKMKRRIIKKIGQPKKKYRRQVHLNYGTEIESEHPGSAEAIFTENGDFIPGYFDIKFNKSLQKHRKSSRPVLELEKEEEDGAETEEWDRFEAFHNDVMKQERAKERIFESEIESVWEKGGSGLVFYTDAQFWRIYEGDEEERNTDEWDLDIAPYYEGGEAPASGSGVFEEHTRGIGRHILEALGWKDGEGLGRERKGMACALQSTGKHPTDRGGVGYSKKRAKLKECVTKRAKLKERVKKRAKLKERVKKRAKLKEHVISNAFDSPAAVDPTPSLYRSAEPSSSQNSPIPNTERKDIVAL